MSLLLFAMAMMADPLSDPCLDDDHNDRCSPAKQAEMRDLYRVPQIETYKNATVRRVFYVDGYGNDVVAIEFVRAAEKDAIVRIHFPKVTGETPIPPIEALLTEAQWREVIDASEHFDRQFAPKATERDNSEGETKDIVLCIHSWVYWAEAIEPGRKRRSTVNDACNDQPVEQFAWFAAKLARRAIPFCNALDPKVGRNDATLLRSCSGLTGDRLAAAQVFNVARGLRLVDRPQYGGGLDGLTRYDFILDFQGAKLKGKNAVAFWQALMIQEDAPDFYYDAIHGVTAKSVVVRGGLLKHVRDQHYQLADLEMSWEEDGVTFRLRSIAVGPYRSWSPATE